MITSVYKALKQIMVRRLVNTR